MKRITSKTRQHVIEPGALQGLREARLREEIAAIRKKYKLLMAQTRAALTAQMKAKIAEAKSEHAKGAVDIDRHHN